MNSIMGLTAGVMAAMAAALGGAIERSETAEPPAKAADPAPKAKASLLDPLKVLVGTWEMEADGKKHVSLVTKLSSAGTVLVETMMPGTDEEMTNMYHLDGDSIVVTHYCAIGNQPRMKCKGPSEPGVYVFTFDSATNLKGPKAMYMGKLTVTIKDNDHMTQDWSSFKDGKEMEQKEHFVYTRKKD